MTHDFNRTILANRHAFHPVIAFDPARDSLVALDFTEQNGALTGQVIEDTRLFCGYIDQQLQLAKERNGNPGASYGIGGYAEHRTIYNRSRVFDAMVPGDEPRRLHLGTDVWGAAGTPVYAFMDAVVHSAAFNDQYGDYGATLILQHQLESFSFYTLYGHLSLRNITGLTTGHVIRKGACIAHFGEPHENGHWPPHLHFQIILNIGKNKGDYPGVCKFSEKEKYLQNSPDPEGILQLNQYVTH